ncbi:hypothetical protein [Actinomadura sp. WMMB 499]|uniref:hypothetical protein n=1 Tax=Actinomadura sp. WMMB 499 TaxID=1219491 RepID=UPI0012465607|nr:hypothetical protein [Actinomadura sp. WMMB 499]QFG25424.1 hypothetical protein F7P10_33970 [Actinomadura sp. WMMB 499]
MSSELFNKLTWGELTLLEDMATSAEEKCYDVYGVVDPFYEDIGEFWDDVYDAYLARKYGESVRSQLMT